MRLKSLVNYWGPVVLLMALMFIGSSDLFSSEKTSRFIGPFLKWFNPEITDDTIQNVQLFVRKMAHLVEYAILCLLVIRALRRDSIATSWSWKTGVLAVGICCLYAMSDEWHQSFVPSREGSPIDVLIDTVGAALGMFSYYGLVRFKQMSET